MQRGEALRWCYQAVLLAAVGNAVLGAAGTGAYAVPHGVRGQRFPRLGSGLELTAA